MSTQPKGFFTFHVLHLDVSTSGDKTMAKSNFDILSVIVFEYPNFIPVPCRHRVEVQ